MYLPGTFVPVAQVGATVRWLGVEPNGAVTEVHDEGGQLLARGEPTSTGRIEGIGGLCRVRGQRQLEDEETGLYYTRYRFFDPEIEQFVSVDPLGIGPDENVFRLGPNVWGWVDPWGLAKFFRGARPGQPPDFTPRHNEFRVDGASGTVTPTHGVSLFHNPESVSSKGFVPHEIDMATVPDTLQIKQRGADPAHFEIMPANGAKLTPEQFTAACQGIGCKR